MNAVRIIGFAVLALVWLWLSWSLIALGGGLNLKNILLILASGIIIFVPLWKKYGRHDNNQTKK